ncbi:hypothetical protein ACXYMO_15755 [Arenibacterium sp. CAU 1754]
MDPDILLTVGLILGGLSVPSVLSALSDGRAPRASAITIMIAGSLILIATTSKPTGYTLDQIPDVFFGVIGKFIG